MTNTTELREQLKAILLTNGFTVKEGHDDLKPYVYAAAEQIYQLGRASAVPEGFVLAPKEPTEEQRQLFRTKYGPMFDEHRFVEDYKALLAIAAAPQEKEGV